MLLELSLTIACLTVARASPAALIRRAADLMGGADAINAIHSKRTTMAATIFANQGQEEWPGAPRPTLSRDVAWNIDWTGNRYRIDRAGPPRLLYVLTPGNGLFQLDTTRSALPGISATSFIADVVMGSPERLMQFALAAPASDLQNVGARNIAGRTVTGVRIAHAGTIDTLTLWFDEVAGYLNAVDMRRTVAGYRNALARVEFSQWSAAGNVVLPQFEKYTLNGDEQTATIMRKTEINPILDDSLFLTRPYATPPSAVALALNSFGDNVMRLSGPTHSSIAIHEGDRTILLESPVSPAQGTALLDSIRARWPRAPVTAVVVSHHHFDHTGGLEPIFARNITVYAADDLIDFLRTFAVTNGDPIPKRKFVAIHDSITIAGGGESVTLYRIPNTHARGLLVGYIPSQKLLFEADLTSGQPVNQRELRDFVKQKGLQVDNISPVHGPMLAWEKFIAGIK